MPHQPKPAVLVLADGTVHHGRSFGAIGTTTGEICFNTGMTGYQEVFTDPSYFGQILIMNAAHIGNYGVKEADVESDSVKISGLIGRNLEDQYSRKQAKGSLDEYLKEHSIVSIEGVDTRSLVAHVRTKGAMNCIISSETTDVNALMEKLKAVPNMDGLELASSVSTKASYELGDASSSIRIAVMDYGVKRNILQCMVDRGAYVKVFPAKKIKERKSQIEVPQIGSKRIVVKAPAENPAITFNDPGIHTVTLISANAAGTSIFSLDIVFNLFFE